MTTTSQPQKFIELSDITDLLTAFARQHKSCFSCTRLDLDENVCRHFKSTPPLRIAQVGCAAYEPDIPF
jgi:hypothetical protein